MEEKENAGNQMGEKFEFGAEIQKLLDILVHSLYSHKEIFLRELISNASDALDKVRFLTLTGKEVRDDKAPLEISIRLDNEKNMLVISDTGIGMTKEELVQNIGTIAHSGSFSFLKAIADNQDGKPDINLIGRFGVGFYAVFMVAKQVEVLTLPAAPGSSASLWNSEGKGTYTIVPAEKETRGTEIRVHLKEEEKEFLEKYRVESIIQKYSDFVSYPIKLEQEKVNKLAAIWHRQTSEIKEEEYEEFFKYLTHNQEKPLSHIHLSFDAPIQFKGILFIPGAVPFDMMFEIPEKWRGVHLYVKRVFIQSDCEELMPHYLRFVRGVVDSDDLPLNISRETLQENQLIGKIRKSLVRKVLEHLAEMSQEKPEDYKKLWKNFGKFIKQGYRMDYENREKLAALFRFNASRCQTEDEAISLDQYIERMVEGQKDIYYLSGEDRDTLEKSPHMELFKKKNIEVLYLTEPVDDFLSQDLREYKGKNLVSADQEGISLDEIKSTEGKSEEKSEQSETSDRAMDDLVGFLKTQLKDRVVDVKISIRLVESPCCLVASKEGPSVGMQKILKMMHEHYEMPKRILEINKNHPMIKKMAQIYATLPREGVLPLLCHQLLDNALLQEGTPFNTKEMVPRIFQMMEKMTEALSDEK